MDFNTTLRTLSQLSNADRNMIHMAKTLLLSCPPTISEFNLRPFPSELRLHFIRPHPGKFIFIWKEMEFIFCWKDHVNAPYVYWYIYDYREKVEHSSGWNPPLENMIVSLREFAG